MIKLTKNILKFKSRHFSSLYIFGSVALLTSACTPVGPNYKRPDVSVPSNYKFSSIKNGKKAAKRERWWTVFNDSTLNGIMKDVRSSNQEFKAAYARFQQSRSNIKTANAQNRPSVSSSPSIQRRSTSAELNFQRFTTTEFILPIDASWEIDLFGRIRRNTEATIVDSQASAEELNNIKLTLEADAAVRYFTIRGLDKEIDIVSDEIDGREKNLLVIEDRFSVGAVSKLDVSQAKAEIAVNRADLADLRRRRSAQVAALALLSGKPASTYSISHSPLTGSTPRIPSSLPSELLRSRPDIRSAERQVAAANARIGVAQATFYPSVSLTGNAGIASTSINNILSNRASMWSIGPEIYIPIFSAGANQAALNFSKERYEEVLANYQQTILKSISEVETCLSATNQLRNRANAESDAVTAAREARLIAKEQYDGGIANYLSVLDAERTAFDIERSRAQTLSAEYVNSVNLIRALGGRW